MDYRAFDINLASLEGLKPKYYSLFTRYYAVVSLITGSTSISRQESPLGMSHGGGKTHTWNYSMRFYVDESTLQQNCVTLLIQLRRRRAFCMDRDAGEFLVPLKNLYDKSLSPNDAVVNSCPNNINNSFGVYTVVTASGKHKGYLCLSFTFGDVFRGAVRRNSDSKGGEGSTLRRSMAWRYSVSPSAPDVGTNPDNYLLSYS